jgi:hypothetical protein
MYSLTGLIVAGVLLQDFTAEPLSNQTDGDRRAGMKLGFKIQGGCGVDVAV